jgi:hypothetical protein
MFRTTFTFSPAVLVCLDPEMFLLQEIELACYKTNRGGLSIKLK